MIPRQLHKSTTLEHVWSRDDLQLPMRWTLFNWILDVASPDVMCLHHSCLWLCFSIVDMFVCLSKAPVMKDSLQVVGITALFLAAKVCAINVRCEATYNFVKTLTFF